MKSKDLDSGEIITGPSGAKYVVEAVNAGRNAQGGPDHVICRMQFSRSRGLDGATSVKSTFDDEALRHFRRAS